MKKGEKRFNILEQIEKFAEVADDLFFVCTLPYGSSVSHIEYELANKHAVDVQSQEMKLQRLRFNDLLYRLRKDNLISDIEKDNKKLVSITKKGKVYLEKLRLVHKNALPNCSYVYQSETTFKLVMFDIPEKMKKWRDWLRRSLQNMEFSMLQKSVFIGKARLPLEFIKDIKEANLFQYVEILEITKTGSLKQFK